MFKFSSLLPSAAGPSVLEVFNTLLKHLKISVDIAISRQHKASEEKIFQEAIVNTIGVLLLFADFVLLLCCFVVVVCVAVVFIDVGVFLL